MALCIESDCTNNISKCKTSNIFRRDRSYGLFRCSNFSVSVNASAFMHVHVRIITVIRSRTVHLNRLTTVIISFWRDPTKVILITAIFLSFFSSAFSSGFKWNWKKLHTYTDFWYHFVRSLSLWLFHSLFSDWKYILFAWKYQNAEWMKSIAIDHFSLGRRNQIGTIQCTQFLRYSNAKKNLLSTLHSQTFDSYTYIR